MSFTGYNPWDGMEIKLEWVTDDKGNVKKVYRIYYNHTMVGYEGKTEFRDDLEAERAFLKITGRRRY